jgi:hypothetical protein
MPRVGTGQESRASAEQAQSPRPPQLVASYVSGACVETTTALPRKRPPADKWPAGLPCLGNFAHAHRVGVAPFILLIDVPN